MSGRAAGIAAVFALFFMFEVVSLEEAEPIRPTAGTSAGIMKLQASYFHAARLDDLPCLQLSYFVGAWIEVRYVRSANCEGARRGNWMLEIFAGRVRWWFKVVPKGVYQLSGTPAYVGPAPRFSPGLTSCDAGGCRILLLDPADGLGYLPRELMSDGLNQIIVPAQVLAHELGHTLEPSDSVRSCRQSLEVENWYLHVLEHRGALRMFHNPPASAAVPGTVPAGC